MLNPPDRGIRGNSHMIMQDKNNLQIADLILQWINERVGNRKATHDDDVNAPTYRCSSVPGCLPRARLRPPWFTRPTGRSGRVLIAPASRRKPAFSKEWPTDGPPLIWTAINLGAGYGSMAVAGDRVFLQGARGPDSVVIALNRADGKEVWAKALGPIDTRMRTNMGAGPRGTPTVDGDRLYVLTENGDLACLKTDGSEVWQLNILKAFGASQLQWMISESPLVDGPHVVVSPGGPGAGIVKLDKMTGKTVWTSKELERYRRLFLDHRRGRAGRPHLHDVHRPSRRRLRASDGKLMFRYPKAANCVANIATPIFSNNKVFFSSALRRRRRAARSDRARTARWPPPRCTTRRNMRNHHGGMVLVNGYLYGFSDIILTCLEFATGTVMWRDRSVGKGSVTYADGHLYIQSEDRRRRSRRGDTVGLPREGTLRDSSRRAN